MPTPSYHVHTLLGIDPFASRLASLGLRKIQLDTTVFEEPKLLRKGLIVPSEVDLLFDIYWDKINVRQYFVF